MDMRDACNYIVKQSIAAVQPDSAVRRALTGREFSGGKLVLVAIGKAAWSMASAAKREMGEKIREGIVITKYSHSMGAIDGLAIFEAGHPVPDENTFLATEAVMRMTESLAPEDTVLLLISGGGSALFEAPVIGLREYARLTEHMLACGANIVEINTIRKRFSKVKGGRFARHCAPARVFSIVLSDIIGDPLDMIASGPAYPDKSTAADALRIAQKYRIPLSGEMREMLAIEPVKRLDNVETVVTGSVRELCKAAAAAAFELGYEPVVLTDSLDCVARDAGLFLASMARYHQDTEKALAFIAGGETIVHITGKGVGGRNQELALAAAQGIAGLSGTAVFSFGSDGTDGPTDAAGGYADGMTQEVLLQKGISTYDALADNDSYHALKACGGLIETGPTGTNVNDVSVALIRPRG